MFWTTNIEVSIYKLGNRVHNLTYKGNADWQKFPQNRLKNKSSFWDVSMVALICSHDLSQQLSLM